MSAKIKAVGIVAALAGSAVLATFITTTKGAAADDKQDATQAIAELQSAVDSLQQRITLLQDTDAIENLISIYGYYLDKQQWDQFASLFADDATMEISERGVYVGRSSIRKALELFGPQGILDNHLHNHMQFQPVIHVAPDGKTAKARSRAFSQLGTYQKNGVWMGGVYENEFVKRDGVWQISKDHVFTTYFADYAKGWSYGALGTAQPSDKIPPDRPATIDYEAFPGVYIPEYHYPHPVTGQPIQFTQPGASKAAP